MAKPEWKVDDAWDIPEGEFCVYGTVGISSTSFHESEANNTLKVFSDPAHADEIEAIYKQTTARAMSDAEPGTIYYCICRDPKERNQFHFYERYTSKEAFDAHNDQEIIKKLVGSGWMKEVKFVFAKAITP